VCPFQEHVTALRHIDYAELRTRLRRASARRSSTRAMHDDLLDEVACAVDQETTSADAVCLIEPAMAATGARPIIASPKSIPISVHQLSPRSDVVAAQNLADQVSAMLTKLIRSTKIALD
jgi:hypothetical protein